MASFFCTLPLNFGETPKDSADMALTDEPDNMIDDNIDTSWELDSDTGSVKFSLGDTAVNFDAYYIISENLGTHELTGLAATILAPRDINRNESTKDSRQYSFVEVPSQSGTNATLTISSRIDTTDPIRIYKVYVLQKLFSVSPSEGFQQIDQTFNLRGARIQEALDGTRTRTRPLGDTGKWSVGYAMNVLTNIDEKVLALNNMFFDNPNFVHVVNWPVHPDRIYQAYLAGDSVGHTYISDYTRAGSVARFQIEQV